MKRWLLILALILPFASPMMAQNVRWDLPVYTVQAQGGNLLPVYAIPGAGVQFFSCSGANCTTLATTYISATSGTTCPTSPTPMQVVLNGTSTCVSSADPYGNMGSWFQPGQYMATITAQGTSYNYYFTVSGQSSGACDPNTIANGCTGGISIPTALQSLNAADAPLTAQHVLHPWDDFDAANGTSMAGRVSPSGNVWNCGGAGTPTINNGAYISTNNQYCGMTDTAIVIEAEGVFSWQTASGETAPAADHALIFSSTGNISTGALLHMSFGSTGWNLLKADSGGGGGLEPLANPPVELHGISSAQVPEGSWMGGPLAIDGTRYKIRGVVDSTACTYTAYLPDGTTWQWTDPDICTIGPEMMSVIWQNGQGAGDAVSAWNEAAIGPSKYLNVATSEIRNAGILNRYLSNTQTTAITPTAAGWYKIATGLTTSFVTMGGTVKIFGFDGAGIYNLFSINVGGQSSAPSDLTPSQVLFTVTPYLTTFANGIVDQVRLSNDYTTGGLQLDIHVNSNYASASLAAQFSGYFVPVVNPTVGANALTNWNIVQSTTVSINPGNTPQVLTGGAGWYTVFTGSQTAADASTTANFQVLISNGILGTQTVNYSVSAYTGACSIWQTSSTNPVLINQLRCSYSASSPYVQIDVYDAQSATYPLTLTNSVFGTYTLNASPTVGAVVLSGGSQTITLAEGSVLTSSIGDVTDNGAATNDVMTCTTAVSGVCTAWGPAPAAGGVNVSGGALGSVPYQTAPGATGVTAPNITAVILCLTELGTGSVGAAPVWGACSGSAATAFSAITTATNTGQTLQVGSSSILEPTASTPGQIWANYLYGCSTGCLATTTSDGKLGCEAVPIWNQPTTGNAATATAAATATTAANLSGTPTLPNGTAATTQSTSDNSTKLATDAYVQSNVAASSTTVDGTTCGLNASCSPPTIVTRTTTNSVIIGSTYTKQSFFNQQTSAAAAAIYTLPTPVAGMIECVKNSNSGGTPNTGVLEFLVANTGTQSIEDNGVISSSGYITSPGAAGDGGCVQAISTTQWEFYQNGGTTAWTVH